MYEQARNRRIFDLWLASHTQEEIATAVRVTQPAIGKVLQRCEDSRFVVKPGELAED